MPKTIKAFKSIKTTIAACLEKSKSITAFRNLTINGISKNTNKIIQNIFNNYLVPLLKIICSNITILCISGLIADTIAVAMPKSAMNKNAITIIFLKSISVLPFHNPKNLPVLRKYFVCLLRNYH